MGRVTPGTMVVEPKHDVHIAQYRAEAAACIERANLEQNKTTAARWVKIAEEWSRMADVLERITKPAKSQQ